MKYVTVRSFACILGFFCLVSLVGCGPALVKVKGTVTKDGQPLKLSRRGVLQVSFQSVAESGGGRTDIFPADDFGGGKFAVPGQERKGIPPGKYLITVQAFDPYPDKDILKGEFGPAKSKIVREVTTNGEEIHIDLNKPGG